MNRDLLVWLAIGGLALLCLALLVTVIVGRRAWHRDLSLAHAELGDLRARVDELENPPVHREEPVAPAHGDYVITGLGTEPRPEPAAPRPDGPLFADIVLRESVVRAASMAHGVRRGLAPATRNRIRFEMKQEVRRSRKQRRADLKAAERDLRARQRDLLGEEAS